MVERLGSGCHNLTVAASNRLTSHAVSAALELCLLEPVKGLLASVLSEARVCPDSADLMIEVSLNQGSPVQLFFNFTGATDSLSETREMLNGSSEVYTFSSPIQGTLNPPVIHSNISCY